MKIKAKPGDFRVRELLDESYLRQKGRFQVYRVTKRKLTSFEAAAALAEEAGVAPGEIGIAGLKDRQGVTTQFMSVPRGKTVRLKTDELSIEPIGFATEALTSTHSSGNAFEITLRGLERREVVRLEHEVTEVRAHGLVNYFGEQRFGNLRHNQGWIARDLALGHAERALESLVATPNEHDDVKNRRFKTALAERWGDWRACREIAGKFGAHHSIFEHLARSSGDFAGAFEFVASRIRLIHLYAWQSHLWNRAVARYVEEVTPIERRIHVSTPEGRLFFARDALASDPSMGNRFRLPGVRLEDVSHPRQRELFVDALAREGLTPTHYAIEGIPGFQLKGEDRELVIHPRELRLSEPEVDRRASGERIRVRFELPRGAYATLVIERLVADDRPAREERPAGRAPDPGNARDRRRVRRAGKSQDLAPRGDAARVRPDSARTAPKRPKPRATETEVFATGDAGASRTARAAHAGKRPAAGATHSASPRSDTRADSRPGPRDEPHAKSRGAARGGTAADRRSDARAGAPRSARSEPRARPRAGALAEGRSTRAGKPRGVAARESPGAAGPKRSTPSFSQPEAAIRDTAPSTSHGALGQRPEPSQERRKHGAGGRPRPGGAKPRGRKR